MIRLVIVAVMLCGFLTASVTHAVIPPVTNFAKMQVSTGYGSAATSIVLLSGHGAKLPATFPFPLIWWNCSDYGAPEDDPFVEIISVTNRTSDTLTVVRAQDGTSASNHSTGGKTYCMILGITKGIIDAIRTDIAAAGVSGLVTSGTGTPEGSVTAGVGTLYARTDGSGTTTLYRKQTGAGTTGWVAQPIFDPASPGPIGLTSASSGSFTSLSTTALTSTLFNLVEATLTYGASVAIDADAGTIHKLTATNSTAFTLANPTNPSTGRLLIIRVRNTSGGVLGTITWDTLYKMGSFTKPANGFSRTVAFVYDGTNWIELFCSPEVPN